MALTNTLMYLCKTQRKRTLVVVLDFSFKSKSRASLNDGFDLLHLLSIFLYSCRRYLVISFSNLSHPTREEKLSQYFSCCDLAERMQFDRDDQDQSLCKDSPIYEEIYSVTNVMLHRSIHFQRITSNEMNL